MNRAGHHAENSLQARRRVGEVPEEHKHPRVKEKSDTRTLIERTKWRSYQIGDLLLVKADPKITRGIKATSGD